VNCKVLDPNVILSERYKKEKLFKRAKKRLARILMHLLTVQIEGTVEAVLRKSTLLKEEG
jgi:hypothetical protein